MRILILGAGGVGGYYGARIHAAGGDVTFLVRPGRAGQLLRDGLKVSSPCGDLHLSPKIVQADKLHDTFDVVILSCKAYDLDASMDAIAPALAQDSVILPLLNGVCHIEALQQRFGPERVLGGVAFISATLAPGGEILHLRPAHGLLAGALHQPPSRWLEPLAKLLGNCGFDFVLAENIEQALWDKFVFLTPLAGATCLMRASVGQILATIDGESLLNGLLDECASVARACGHAVSDERLADRRAQLNDRTSNLTASMLRDLEKGGATEAGHILGDMVARASKQGLVTPLLRLACSHLQAYDLRRRESTA